MPGATKAERHHHHHEGDEHEHAHAHDHDHDHHVDAAHAPHPHPHGHDDRVLRVERSLFEKNDRFAAANRRLFAERRLFALNLWSSPGAGKTTLIERLLDDLGGELPMSVIEGDLATERDADRIRARGGHVVQIETGAVCHLDAHMVGHALEDLAPRPRSVVLVENVGNLVCPAMFDLGEHERVALLSITEGEDKPIKYPHIFAKSTAIVFTKMDLLPHLSFDIEEAVAFARRVNRDAPIFRVSAKTGGGMPEFYSWLQSRAAAALEEAS